MARRRSIYDAGTYQTPLADFIEQIPNYFLKWEELKLRAAREKESDRRWNKTQENQAHQRSFDAAKIQLSDELKHISMAPILQQDALYEKIKPTYIKHPELTGLINSRISANDAVEGVADRHLDIQSKISDYKVSGNFGRFSKYYDMLEDSQELSKLAKEVHGTSYQSEIDADIVKLDEWLEFSKQNADKPMPKSLWEYELDRTNYNQTAKQRFADSKMADVLSGEIATARSGLITLELDKTSVSYKSALEVINQKQNQLINLVGGEDAKGNKIQGRIAESDSILYGIEQNNKWNPLGGTTKVLEGGVFGYEPKTEMKADDIESFILNNPEEGFDAWLEFLENPSEESENKLNSMLNEFIEGESKVGDIITPETIGDTGIKFGGEEEITREERWASNIKKEKIDIDEGTPELESDEIVVEKISTTAEPPKGVWGNSGGALAKTYDTIEKIKKAEDIASRYPDQKENSTRKANKLREQLKKDILSIYNPNTGEFRYPGYDEMFSPSGDISNTGEQLDTRNVAGGFTGIRNIPVADIMSFIESLFPKQFANK